jgi:5-methylcytosine-specific restriction endonuclease McrA
MFNDVGMKQVYRNRIEALPGKTHDQHRNREHFNLTARLKGYRCAMCLHITIMQTLDHIIPRSKGGKSHIDNMQILCLRHHREKDNLPVKK